MRKHRIFTPLLLLSLMAALYSCKLNDEPPVLDVDFQSTLDNSFAESEFAAIQTAFDVEAQQSDLIKKTSAGIFCSCAEVSVTELASLTYEMVIDFGDGCTCIDGRKRAGKLIGVFHAKWSQVGSYVDITPENYQVTNLQGFVFDFEFKKRITYQGPDTNGYPTWVTKVQDAILRNQGEKILWDATHTTQWVEGVGDLDPTNNVYLVTGNASGYNLKVEPFTAFTEKPLRIEAGCAHPTSGILVISPAGQPLQKLDYGDGTCDNKATFWLGELSAELTLR